MGSFTFNTTNLICLIAVSFMLSKQTSYYRLFSAQLWWAVTYFHVITLSKQNYSPFMNNMIWDKSDRAVVHFAQEVHGSRSLRHSKNMNHRLADPINMWLFRRCRSGRSRWLRCVTTNEAISSPCLIRSFIGGWLRATASNPRSHSLVLFNNPVTLKVLPRLPTAVSLREPLKRIIEIK